MRVPSSVPVFSLIILGIGILASVARADDEKEAILKIADALQKGDEKAARKLVAAMKDPDSEAIMDLMRDRKKNGGGLGIGPKPGAIAPDGIDRMVRHLRANAPRPTDFAALERSAYIMRAIALAIHDARPTDPKGKWKQYSDDYDKAAQEFIKVVKKKDAKAVQKIAANLYDRCTTCHSDYK